MSFQANSSIWKKHFLLVKKLDVSNTHLDKLKKAVTHGVSFPKSFEEISKNEGVSYLILDPTETHLQLLHHGHVLGGNWASPAKKLVAILGCDSEARPVQIVQKSIKNIKEKSFSLQKIRENIDDRSAYRNSARISTMLLSLPGYLLQMKSFNSKTSCPFPTA
jgi:hypothetical protein